MVHCRTLKTHINREEGGGDIVNPIVETHYELYPNQPDILIDMQSHEYKTKNINISVNPSVQVF